MIFAAVMPFASIARTSMAADTGFTVGSMTISAMPSVKVMMVMPPHGGLTLHGPALERPQHGLGHGGIGLGCLPVHMSDGIEPPRGTSAVWLFCLA